MPPRLFFAAALHTAVTAIDQTTEDQRVACLQDGHVVSLNLAEDLSYALTSIDVSCYSKGMITQTPARLLPLRHKNEPCCAPVTPPRLTTTQTDGLADQLKALGDATRLRMLDLLVQQPDPLCVCDITAQFSQNQPTISHHLRLLREAGLIDTEKRGIWAYYWATEKGRRYLAALQVLA